MILSIVILMLGVLAAAAPGSPPSQGSDDPQTSIALQSNISAAVLDRVGKDVTSSFEIRVYHEPKVIAEGNLTNRQTPLSRAITLCPVPNTNFVRSYCDPETLIAGTLQRYTIICRRVRVNPWTQAAARLGAGTIIETGSTAPIRNSIVERAGYCQYDEICITTSRYTDEANCVKITYFQRIMASWNGAQSAMDIVNAMAWGDVRHSLDFGLGGRTGTVMMSDMNGTMPIEVDTLDLEASANGHAGQKEGQTTKCRDCVDLRTDRLNSNTDFLKTEARLLTTGGAAGIMWLAFMSG